jgi:hypothetical protein
MANLREENEPQIRTKFPCDVNVRSGNTVIDVKWPLPAFYFVCNDCNDDFSGGEYYELRDPFTVVPSAVLKFTSIICQSIFLHHVIREFSS